MVRNQLEIGYKMNGNWWKIGLSMKLKKWLKPVGNWGPIWLKIGLESIFEIG